MSYWPDAQNMVVAMGPGGAVVDVRAPGQYERWSARDGLTCLDCTQPVNPRRLHKETRSQRDILVHSPQRDGLSAEERCAEIRRSGRRGAGWKRVLKEQLVPVLQGLGFVVALDQVVAGERVDLAASRPDRRVLLRLELDRLPRKEAHRIHNALSAGTPRTATDILWITFGCTWVDELPAVGIRFVDDVVKEAVDVGGLAVVVDAGILRFSTKKGGLYQPTDELRGLGGCVRLLTSGRLVYVPLDEKHSGWAFTTGVRMHLHQTRRDLANARSLKSEAAQVIRTQSTEIERMRREMAAQGHTLTSSQGRVLQLEEHLGRVREELEAAQERTAILTSWAGAVEEFRDSSIPRRLMLRALPDAPV